MSRSLSTLNFSLFLLILFSNQAFAAAEFDPLKSGLKMLWGLGIVLAILLVCYFLLKKNLSTFQQKDKGIIKVIEVKHVMPKKSLMLIEVRGREYLVGAGSDTINTITPLRNEGTFSSLLAESEHKKSL